MTNIAVCMCRGDKKKTLNKNNFIGHFLAWLKSIFKRPRIEELVDKIDLYNNLTLYQIKLPYFIDELVSKPAKLEKMAARILDKYSIEHLVLPQKLLMTYEINGCIKNSFCGSLLFKSLLTNILEEFYDKRGYKISSLDITIIHGNSFLWLYNYIKLLSTIVKYITVVTREREMVEKEMERVLDETGLSVGITSEYKSGIRDADLIINMDDLRGVDLNSKINPKAVLINYEEIDAGKTLAGNTVINGINIELPVGITSKFDSRIFEYYNKLEIAEIILCKKIGISDKIVSEVPDYKVMESLSGEFKREGYEITGFIGRYNTFGPQTLKLRK